MDSLDRQVSGLIMDSLDRQVSGLIELKGTVNVILIVPPWKNIAIHNGTMKIFI